MTASKSAAERLAQAKRELKEVERQIDAAAEHRREALREGPADGAAAVRADRKLENLKLWRVRLLDQLDVLPALVMREESEAAFPPTASASRERLAAMRERLARLRSKRPLDLSAADQAEIDALVPGIGAMGQRVAFLAKFEANSRGEVA